MNPIKNSGYINRTISTGAADKAKERGEYGAVQRPGIVGDFGSILKSELEKKSELKFSKHAAQRLDDRNIPISTDLQNKLNQAVEMAQGKGLRDMVIIDNQNAFVVNVPNKTVITAVSGTEMKNNIFTNIDGVVMI
jgi:flagellar operon protein